MSFGGSVAAQPAAKPQAAATATAAQEFYFNYRLALNKATSMEDLKPWMAQKGYQSATSTTKESQAMLFKAMKVINTAIGNVAVTDRVAAADTVVLRLRGVDARDQQSMLGAAIIVREVGGWRLGREDWRSAR